jgi:hypothetical protein
MAEAEALAATGLHGTRPTAVLSAGLDVPSRDRIEGTSPSLAGRMPTVVSACH